MEINTNENGEMEFSKVYSPIKLIADKKEELIISMRDGGFEVAYDGFILQMKKGSINMVNAKEENKVKFKIDGEQLIGIINKSRDND